MLERAGLALGTDFTAIPAFHAERRAFFAEAPLRNIALENPFVAAPTFARRDLAHTPPPFFLASCTEMAHRADFLNFLLSHGQNGLLVLNT